MNGGSTNEAVYMVDSFRRCVTGRLEVARRARCRLTQWQRDVEAFHRKFGVPVGARPFIDRERVGLRSDLIMEEIVETITAMQQRDLAEMADGIIDSIYVLIGTAVEFGIDLEPLWDAVQASNMRKEGGGTRSDGKILKPAGWSKPPIAMLLLEQTERALTRGE